VASKQETKRPCQDMCTACSKTSLRVSLTQSSTRQDENLDKQSRHSTNLVTAWIEGIAHLFAHMRHDSSETCSHRLQAVLSLHGIAETALSQRSKKRRTRLHHTILWGLYLQYSAKQLKPIPNSIYPAFLASALPFASRTSFKSSVDKPFAAWQSLEVQDE